MKTEVYCTLQVEGIHNWPSCPFDEVAYLRVPHRHMFHIKAHVSVQHSDRDVEFIMLKNKIDKYLTHQYADDNNPANTSILHFGPRSCEMIAVELVEKFNLSKCEVSEDHENGAVVYGD